MHGVADSLNVSAAGAVLLYEARAAARWCATARPGRRDRRAQASKTTWPSIRTTASDGRWPAARRSRRAPRTPPPGRPPGRPDDRRSGGPGRSSPADRGASRQAARSARARSEGLGAAERRRARRPRPVGSRHGHLEPGPRVDGLDRCIGAERAERAESLEIATGTRCRSARAPHQAACLGGIGRAGGSAGRTRRSQLERTWADPPGRPAGRARPAVGAGRIRPRPPERACGSSASSAARSAASPIAWIWLTIAAVAAAVVRRPARRGVVMEIPVLATGLERPAPVRR